MMSTPPLLNSTPASMSNQPMTGGYSTEGKPAACAGCKRTGLNLLVCDDCASPSDMSSAGNWSKQRYCAQCMIGKKVRVFWPLDEQWYVGVVQRYDPGTGEHLLTYPDGDTEWVKIGDSPSNVAAAQADMMASSHSNHSPPQKQHNNHSPNGQGGVALPVTPGQGGRGPGVDMPPSPPPQQDQMMGYSMQHQRSSNPYENPKQQQQQQYDRNLRASQQEHLSAISQNRIQPQDNRNPTNQSNSSPESLQKHHTRPHGNNVPPQGHGHMHGQPKIQQSGPSPGNLQNSPPSGPPDTQPYSHGYSSVSQSQGSGGGGDWHSNMSQGGPPQGPPQAPPSPGQQSLNSSKGPPNIPSHPNSYPQSHSSSVPPQRPSQQHPPPHTPQNEASHSGGPMPPYMPGPGGPHSHAPPHINYHHSNMPSQQMHPYPHSTSGPPQPYLLPRPYMFPPPPMGGNSHSGHPHQEHHMKEENDNPESGSGSSNNPNNLGPKRKSGPKTWTKEEDAILLNMVQSMRMPMKWSIVAQSMPDRTGKQCRERYVNHLNPRLKNAEWSPMEDATIFHLYNSVGSQWAKMSKMIPGRTDNGIKNRFHNLRRQLEREDEHRLRLSKPEDFPDEIHLGRIRDTLPDNLKGKNDQLWDMHKGIGILAAQSVIGAGIARNAGKYGPFRVVGKEGEQCARCGLLVPSVQCGVEICEKTKWCQSCTRIPPHVSGNLLRECLNLRKCQEAPKAKIIDAWITVREKRETGESKEDDPDQNKVEIKVENEVSSTTNNNLNENKGVSRTNSIKKEEIKENIEKV